MESNSSKRSIIKVFSSSSLSTNADKIKIEPINDIVCECASTAALARPTLLSSVCMLHNY
jgi:hypothetical protein